MGWADCKTRASPPGHHLRPWSPIHSSHIAGKMATPSPSWGLAAAYSVFSSLVTKLLPSYNVKEGTGT